MIHKNIKVKHKKAFSMVTAIFTIVIMASVTSLIMSVTGKTIHETTAQFQKEQAFLLARSYTELAILYALHRDRGVDGCINTINAKFGEDGNLYDITVDIQYTGNTNNVPTATCDILGETTGGNWGATTNTGFNATVSLLVDVYVRYKDLNHPLNNNGNTPTDDVLKTFHRRTLQRI
ncbi:MAG: type II secretion system protein [Sulfurovaceae bacterium]|nr:type II secretion system protein [Sulfurovaceae bacterium]